MVSPVLATWQRNWSKIGHTSFFPLFSKSVGVRMAREEWRNRRQKDKKYYIKNRNHRLNYQHDSLRNTLLLQQHLSWSQQLLQLSSPGKRHGIFSWRNARTWAAKVGARLLGSGGRGCSPPLGDGTARSGRDGESWGREGRGSAGRSPGRGQPGGCGPTLGPPRPYSEPPAAPTRETPRPPPRRRSAHPRPLEVPEQPRTSPQRGDTAPPPPAARAAPPFSASCSLSTSMIRARVPPPPSALLPSAGPPPPRTSKRAPGAARTDTARAQQPSNMAPGPSPCAAPTARPPSRRGAGARGRRGRAGPEGGGPGRGGAVCASPQAGRAAPAARCRALRKQEGKLRQISYVRDSLWLTCRNRVLSKVLRWNAEWGNCVRCHGPSPVK